MTKKTPSSTLGVFRLFEYQRAVQRLVIREMIISFLIEHRSRVPLLDLGVELILGREIVDFLEGLVEVSEEELPERRLALDLRRFDLLDLSSFFFSTGTAATALLSVILISFPSLSKNSQDP